jgi:hypothetical protein
MYIYRCVIDFPAIIFTIPPEIVFTYYGFLLGFLLPVSMITTFYVLVLVRLHHIRRKHQSEFKQRSHRKVTRVVLAVITAYFICWVPYWFLQIFITIDPLIHSLGLNYSILPSHTNMSFLKELTHLTTIIGYANNCLNPVLYVFLSDSFREEYLSVLNCFHSNRGTFTNNISNGISQPREKKSKQKQRTPSTIKKRREIALKKVKHSVFIDDMPSENRSISYGFHRSNDQKRFSASSIPLQVSEYDENPPRRKTSTTEQTFHNKKSNHSPKKKLKVNISTNSVHFPESIIDDGGVYCGN